MEELLRCRAALGEQSVTLLLVGGGPQEQELQVLAAKMHLLQNGKVVFAGMVAPQQVAAYYHLGDVFASASTSETQGLTYAEALAAGLPAVCRADACLAGVIENGVNGWQYETQEELYRHVCALLAQSGLRGRMAQAAPQFAAQFSAVHFAKSMVKLYGEAMHKKEAAANAQKGEALWQKA